MKNDADFRKIKRYRISINQSLRGTHRTNKHLGCTTPQLWKWFKFLFSNGMSKENYAAVWVVDHVIPLARAAQCPKDFFHIARWYNITPYLKRDNLHKNQYVDPTQLHNHMQKYEEYCTLHKIPMDQNYVDLCARHLEDRERPDLVTVHTKTEVQIQDDTTEVSEPQLPPPLGNSREGTRSVTVPNGKQC